MCVLHTHMHSQDTCIHVWVYTVKTASITTGMREAESKSNVNDVDLSCPENQVPS